jgi:hypothetical protein
MMLRSSDLKAASEQLRTAATLLTERAGVHASTATAITRGQETFDSGLESPLKQNFMRAIVDLGSAASSTQKELLAAAAALNRLFNTASRLAGEAATFESRAAAAESALQHLRALHFGLPLTSPTDTATQNAQIAEAEGAVAAAQVGLRRIADDWRGACISASNDLTRAAQALEGQTRSTLREFVSGLVGAVGINGRSDDSPARAAANRTLNLIRSWRVDRFRRSQTPIKPPTVGNGRLLATFATRVDGWLPSGRVPLPADIPRPPGPVATALSNPVVQSVARKISIAGAAYGTTAGVANLRRQGNIGDAFQERGSHYVEDWAGTLNSGAMLLLYLPPNPLTPFFAGAVIVTGVVYVGVSVWNRRERIGGILDRSGASEYSQNQTFGLAGVGQVLDTGMPASASTQRRFNPFARS